MTVTDLLKLITRYPSSANLVVGHNPDETGELSGEVIHSGDDLILLLKPLPVADKSRQPAAATADEEFDDGSELLAADEAVEQCDNILELIEELPERAEEFGDSVREKVESMKAWIVEHDHVTEAQQQSLTNMESAVLRWIR